MAYNFQNDNEKQIFKRLSPEDKLDAAYEILAFVRTSLQEIAGRQATADKNIIQLQKEVDRFEREARAYRKVRADRERKVSDLLDTNPDIKALPQEDKQKLTDKFMAIVTRQDEKWLPLIKEAMRIILILIGLLIGKQLLP